MLSLGVIDGRNIWRTDLDAALALLQRAAAKHTGPLWIAPSCSLLHIPFSLTGEDGLDPDIRTWLAFACEKLHELQLLQSAFVATAQGSQPDPATQTALQAQRDALAQRRSNPHVHRSEVAQRLASAQPADYQRHSPFPQRQAAQRQRLQLPLLPTTTIGSFPQTPAIRATRAAYRRGNMDTNTYHAAMQAEIAQAIRKQEVLGLDVLVHGEAERNDMVEYFGEQLHGYAFTRSGWVQSYGSRCVKPPHHLWRRTTPRPHDSRLDTLRPKPDTPPSQRHAHRPGHHAAMVVRARRPAPCPHLRANRLGTAR